MIFPQNDEYRPRLIISNAPSGLHRTKMRHHKESDFYRTERIILISVKVIVTYLSLFS